MKPSAKTTDAEFLRRYDASRYDKPSSSIDCVIYTVIAGQLHVLLVKRAEPPFQGAWSLVGGYIQPAIDTDLLSTAKRKLREKTGVKTPYLEQCVTVGSRDRDPRGWSVTTVYYALLAADSIRLAAGAGAQSTTWAPVKDGTVAHSLAFDHTALLTLCTERLKSKVLYTSLPLYLMPPEFTVSELQRCYETILERRLESKSFRRRMLSADIIEPTGKESTDTKRPAQLYRRRKSPTPHYFTRTIEGQP